MFQRAEPKLQLSRKDLARQKKRTKKLRGIKARNRFETDDPRSGEAHTRGKFATDAFRRSTTGQVS